MLTITNGYYKKYLFDIPLCVKILIEVIVLGVILSKMM